MNPEGTAPSLCDADSFERLSLKAAGLAIALFFQNRCVRKFDQPICRRRHQDARIIRVMFRRSLPKHSVKLSVILSIYVLHRLIPAIS